MESEKDSLAREGALQECAIKSRVSELFDAEGCNDGDGDQHSGKTSDTICHAHIRNASTCSGGEKPLPAVMGKKPEMVTPGM